MRSRAIAAVISMLGSLGVILALAVPAAAAVGPRFFSPEQAGYVATGARFRIVESIARLPSAANFAPELAGENYTQARMGAEFADNPWGTFSYHAPAAETRLVTFRGSFLVTYSGSQSSLISWWARHKAVAASNGSSTGTVQVKPHDPGNRGASFGIYLQP